MRTDINTIDPNEFNSFWIIDRDGKEFAVFRRSRPLEVIRELPNIGELTIGLDMSLFTKEEVEAIAKRTKSKLFMEAHRKMGG